MKINRFYSAVFREWGGDVVGRGGGGVCACVLYACVCVFLCVCVSLCVCECAVVSVQSFLSDGDPEFFQHSDSLLLVLLPGQPEVVLVLHDVGQHGPAQEHHVLSPGWILDTDLEFLHGEETKRRLM